MTIQLPELTEAELAADRIERLANDIILQARHLRAAYRVPLDPNRPTTLSFTRVNKTKLKQEQRRKELLEKLDKKRTDKDSK